MSDFLRSLAHPGPVFETRPDAPAGAVGPFLLNGTGDGWRCRCGAARHVGYPDRCAKGHGRPQNSIPRQTGVYAREQPEALRVEVERLTQGITADLGGDSELSTLERAYVSRLGDVEITLRLLAHDIARRGLLTPSGGVRRVYDQLLAGIDRWDRLAQRLGMRRRAKQLDLAQAFAEHARGGDARG